MCLILATQGRNEAFKLYCNQQLSITTGLKFINQVNYDECKLIHRRRIIHRLNYLNFQTIQIFMALKPGRAEKNLEIS